jgi:hypothetical protein
MSFIISPNMNLPIPTVGGESGPQYATDVNNSLTLVDQHNHTPGQGVQIPPSGLNINSSLTFNNNLATSLQGLTFVAQSGSPGINTIWESGVDLYFTDGLGNLIQITKNGAVAGTPGSIANLVPPASASYVSGSSTFVFQSGAGIAANLDAGSLFLRDLSPNSTFALELSPPAGLSSNYTITFPTLPSSQKIVTLDNSGNLAASWAPDNATIVVSSNTLEVGTIQTANIASQAVTAAQIANNTITPAQLSTTIFGLGLNATSSGILTGSGNFTVPAGVNRILILGWGGGGGGGNGSGIGGAGGNGAAVQLTYMDVTPAQVIAYSCGVGGNGGSPAGANGGLTTFGALSFSGGNGGGSGSSGGQPGSQISPNGNVQANAGANGNSAAASLYAAGGIAASPSASTCGGGGSGSYGIGGNGEASGNPGSNGTNGGGGGGGGAGAGGGQGGAGGLIIEW